MIRTKPHANLVFGDNVLSQVDNFRDLGVTGHRLANLIHKYFASKDPPTLMRARTAYVRPLLE